MALFLKVGWWFYTKWCQTILKVSLHNKILKKVPKVVVLRSICFDLERDSVYSNKMHSAFLWLGKGQKPPQYYLVPFYCYALTFVGVHCTTHIATFAHCRQLKCMSGLDSYTNQWPLFYTCRNLWLNGCLQAPEITCFLIIHPSTKTKTTAVSPEASLLSALFCKKRRRRFFVKMIIRS